jgi:site-specific recombinase XerD
MRNPVIRGFSVFAVQYYNLGGSSSLIPERKPGYLAQAQGVHREVESEGRKAKVQAEACSEPEVAFHVDDPPYLFATWLVQAGVSLYEGQKLLGHSSITTTQVYAHLAASELHGAVNRISLDVPEVKDDITSA